VGVILGRYTCQRCRAEDCLVIDMEWFATGFHW